MPMWPPKLAACWLTLRRSYQCYSKLWSHGLARSCYKLKPLYLYYYAAYDHQTWQRCDLSWGGTTDKVTWSFGNVLPRHYVTNLGRMVTNLKGLLPMLFDPLVRWSCEIIWQTKISNSSLHMATNKVCITIKLGMGVTCYEGIPPIMSHNPLITCSFEITWKVLAGWQLALRDSYPCYLTFWPRGFARSYDKQKSLYLCYHTAYGNQTWQCCDLP